MENQDKELSDLSVMFHSFLDDPIFCSDLLNPKILDYSTESLSRVDDYLDEIRNSKDVEKTWNKTVLRAGAYVGEVIRRAAPQHSWHWRDYEAARVIDPRGWKDFEKSIVTSAVLHRGGRSFCFPLGKVFKFLENGREDSVKFFAEVIISRWNDEEAQQQEPAN